MPGPAAGYPRHVLACYLALPDTPRRASRADRLLAGQLQARPIPLAAVETALCLATARRLARDPARPPLGPIRSLHYFLPVIEEILANPLHPDYGRYCFNKIAPRLKAPWPQPSLTG